MQSGRVEKPCRACEDKRGERADAHQLAQKQARAFLGRGGWRSSI